MRKNDRFEQELNVAGAARRAKAFGIKIMTVVVTAAMLVSGVPTRVIAEGLQEAGVIAAQDSTDQGASSGGQQAADQPETQSQEPATNQSNTQEQSQATSEQAAQPGSQDNAAVAQNDSPSAQPAPFAQPSQQTATADIALTLNNASITYKGQVVAQPVQKVTAPTSDSFQFTVQPDNGYKLSKVALTVSGTDRELKADANGLYTVDAADVAQSPRVTLQTEQEKTAEPAKEATPIEDAEDVEGESAAVDQPENKKSDEKDVSTAGFAAPTDAKKRYTVEVGGTVTIYGKSGFLFNKWTSSNPQTATVSNGDDKATVTGKNIGTVTITHYYGLTKKETFKVQVKPVQPKISGTDTVEMGKSTRFTVSGFEQGQTVQWMSENSNVATVDANGRVTGVHVGKTNITAYTSKQSASKQIEVKRDDSSGGYYVYLYTKAEGNTDGLSLTLNESGWYTIGRVWVRDIDDPATAYQNGKSQENENFTKTIDALQNPDNIDLYGVNSINLSDINWRASGDYGITLAPGADDYPEATGTQWHLDGYVYFDSFGSLTFHYKDADTGEKIYRDYDTTAKVTGEDFDFSSRIISIAGYTYDHADPASVRVEKNKTNVVTLYYKKGTFPYTVKYLEADTKNKLHTEKSGTGEYGSTVTENAIDIDGYELVDGKQKQQSIQLGTDVNVIIFYYKKAKASYTVNYYWNGTTEKVAYSKTVHTKNVNDEVTEAPVTVNGCTPVSTGSQTITLVKGKNEINFYYYKNVELKAKSKEATYNGEEHSVSDFTGAPEGADFSEITVGASGTNAGTYPASFEEGTVGKVDKTGKYIVTKATDGRLLISPVTDQVTVTITGNKDTKPYNGYEQSVTGYEFESSNELYVKRDVEFTGDATAKGTAVGTYNMQLRSEQFSNNNANFTNVKFVVNDGSLEITGGEIDQNGVKWKTNNLKKVYDGTPLAAYTASATDKHGNALNVEYSDDEGGTWTSDPSKITLTHFGNKNVMLRATGSNYADDQYATSSESIEITKRPVTLTSEGATKSYDGNPLTNETVTVTPKGEGVGFVDDEGVTITVTGSQTEKGDSDNTFTYEFNEGTSEDDYSVTSKYGKLTVTPNANEVVVTITEHSGEFEYDDTEKSVSGYDFTASNELYKQGDFTFTGEATVKGTNVGNYDMELKPSDFTNNNQNFSTVTFVIVDGQLSITSKSIETGKDMTVEKPADVLYNGKVQQQEPVVKDGDKTLVEGTDYTLSYSEDATNVGTVTVTVTGMGNYSGSVAVTYEITKRSVKLTGVKDVTKVYDGTALEAKDVTVSGDGFVEGEVTDIKATGSVTEVTAMPVVNPIVFTAGKGFKEGNYTIEKDPGTLQVTARPIDDITYGMSVSRPMNVEYDGNPHKWAPTVKDGEKTLAEGTDYTVAYSKDDFTNATGAITVTITGKGNYAGTIAKSYRITKAPLHVVTGSATKVYDGKALTSETVTIDGLAKRDRIGIAVTGSQTNVGSSQNTYTIDWMQTSADNYELTDELGTLTVTAAPARPSTPTTPVTPTTPTVPNPTPNSSDGGSTTTTAAPTGEDSATGNDQEQKEEKIIDAKNPLGKFDGKKDTCWVHWYMIICAVATAAYGLFVGLRRDKHSRRLQNDLDKVLGNDDETQE